MLLRPAVLKLIALCPDFMASDLRGLARRGKNAAQAGRLLSLAVIHDGGSRAEAAHLGAPRHKANGAALVLPHCNTEAMSLHLAEITTMISPGRHAMLLLDPAAWPLPAGLTVPPNITMLPLSPTCPTLNVIESVWQFMRDTWLSNRVGTGGARTDGPGRPVGQAGDGGKRQRHRADIIGDPALVAGA